MAAPPAAIAFLPRIDLSVAAGRDQIAIGVITGPGARGTAVVAIAQPRDRGVGTRAFPILARLAVARARITVIATHGVAGGFVGRISIDFDRHAVVATLAVVLGVILSVSAVIGDLIESLFKREAGVKDSGHFFPGIGGILDLLDSILFNAPLMYLYLRHVLTHPHS